MDAFDQSKSMERRMEGIGYLDAQRLSNIPSRFHAQHEFCFYLHDSMLRMFQELAGRRYPSITLNFKSQEDVDRFQAAPDPITYFLENEHGDIARDLSVGQAMMAILADFFNFIYEGLTSLEKRKFVVAFALLRKPLKQNLLLLTMMLADKEKFFEGLKDSPSESFDHPGIQDIHRKSYFAKAKKLIPYGSFVDPQILHDLIFNVANPNGLAPLFDKAAHLVTRRSAIKTEELNLNFIFKSPQESDIYDGVYYQLSYILLYALLLEIELFKESGFHSEKMAVWFALTGLGVFESLFIRGRPSVVASMNDLLGEFLTCPHCDAPVRLTKRNAARFFVTQEMRCKKCGHDHQFPLFWLMSKVKWRISDKEGAVAVEDLENEQ